MKKLIFMTTVVFASLGMKAQTPIYQDESKPLEERVQDALNRMSLEEKVCQVSAELVEVEELDKRDYTKGLVRTPAPFLTDRNITPDPKSVAEVINEDTGHSRHPNNIQDS